MAINSFHGMHEFLSNFFPSTVMLDDVEYSTVEHAYAAAKTLDLDERWLIRSAATPGKAKRLGRNIQLRNDWEAIKEQIMLDLLRQKFQIPELKKLLLDTGNQELIEGNHWNDTYWVFVMELERIDSDKY